MVRQTILIIDDIADHRDILSRFLCSVGYRVIAAAPGREAMDQAQRERPDLILAALSLPGQPGWETARQLGSIPGLGATPILGTTLYNTLLSASRVRAIGCAAFIEKPFDFDGLLYHISKLMPPAVLAPAA